MPPQAYKGRLPENVDFGRISVTAPLSRASFSIEHIARAAVSLPAAGEPVWYPFHAGSRRAENSVHPLRGTTSS
jgi:hypothetical protein